MSTTTATAANAAESTEAKPKETKAERIAREIQELDARLAAGDLDDTRTRVAYILNQYPTTRRRGTAPWNFSCATGGRSTMTRAVTTT